MASMCLAEISKIEKAIVEGKLQKMSQISICKTTVKQCCLVSIISVPQLGYLIIYILQNTMFIAISKATIWYVPQH